MLGDHTFRLRTPFEDLLVRIDRFARAPSAEQRELARRALSDLRFGIEGHDPGIVATAQQIVIALDGGGSFGLFSLRELGPSLNDAQFEAQLLRRLEEEFELGRLVVEREQIAPLTERRDLFDPPIPPLPPAPRESKTHTFEVRFVDEVGKAISGIDAEFTADGAQTRTTNAAGVALLEGVQATAASVEILDIDALSKVLDLRWDKSRPGKPPKEGNMQEVVFRGAQLGPFSLKAEVPNTVIVKPPLGELFAELFDKTGRVRLANTEYTIDGPMSFSGTTDDAGRLLHDDVFPGDYKLSLALTAFEGTKDEQVDIFETQLVVLDAGASDPQVRMIGAVPRIVLSRMRGMLFDTNKTFLLPTAVPALKTMREVYEANPRSELLIVGHADTTGTPGVNDPLSRDRSRSMRAYLQDDVDTWLKNYELSGPQRWGVREDRLMITAAKGFAQRNLNDDIVEWFQRSRHLDVDGVIGPKTRRQLITEYMQLDSVNLIADPDLNLVIESHGAGENFPLDETGEDLDPIAVDGVDDVFNRRVELFFFDDEFGVVPAPGAADGPEYLEWRKRAVVGEDVVAGTLAPTPITLLEVRDLFFRTDSAVVHQNLVCPSVLAFALMFANARPSNRLVVAGHTDTRAPDAHNQPLSEERADNSLACLVGDRAAFVRLSLGRHKIADEKQILQFVTKKLGFSCDVTPLDENAATLAGPARKFQEQYNDKRAALGVPTAEALQPDGVVGEKTWGAFFDCYEAFLATQVSTAPSIDAQLAALADLRQGLRFVDESKKSIGFGEWYPVDHPGVDTLASATNRRVELLFFPNSDLPDLGLPLDVSDIYLPGRYRRNLLDPCAEPPPPPPPPPPARPDPTPGLGRLFARAVQFDGSRVSNVEFFLFDLSVGRTQIDTRSSGSGEVDFGERAPGNYEVDVVKTGFSGGPAIVTLAAGESQVAAIALQRVGDTEQGRILVEAVVTAFRIVTRQQVSPIKGDVEVSLPPEAKAAAAAGEEPSAIRARIAASQHRTAVQARVSAIEKANGSNVRRIQLDTKPEVVVLNTDLDKDKGEGVPDIGAPIFLNIIEDTTTRTIIQTSLKQ